MLSFYLQPKNMFRTNWVFAPKNMFRVRKKRGDAALPGRALAVLGANTQTMFFGANARNIFFGANTRNMFGCSGVRMFYLVT